MKLLIEGLQPAKKAKKSPSEKKKKSVSSKSESKPKKSKVSESEKETTASQGAAALKITETSGTPQPIDLTTGSRDSVLEKPVSAAEVGGSGKREKTFVERALNDPGSFF